MEENKGWNDITKLMQMEDESKEITITIRDIKKWQEEIDKKSMIHETSIKYPRIDTISKNIAQKQLVGMLREAEGRVGGFLFSNKTILCEATMDLMVSLTQARKKYEEANDL